LHPFRQARKPFADELPLRVARRLLLENLEEEIKW